MKRRGFTLLEVLVATTIMGIAVVGLLSAMSTSLRNLSRLTDYDRARMIARRTMDTLLTEQSLPKMTVIEGRWDQRVLGVEGGWRARVSPFERAPNASPGQMGMERIELEIWWMQGGERRTFDLEAYRAAKLTPEDLSLGPMVQ